MGALNKGKKGDEIYVIILRFEYKSVCSLVYLSDIPFFILPMETVIYDHEFRIKFCFTLKLIVIVIFVCVLRRGEVV